MSHFTANDLKNWIFEKGTILSISGIDQEFSFKDTMLVVFLAILVFSYQSYLAHIWNLYGVFSQYNVIFDSDPNHWKSAFANGWSFGGFNHPLLSYFFAIPARGISKFSNYLGFVNDEQVFRETLALYVAPVLTSLKAVCLYLVFRILNLDRIKASIVTGIGAASFSSVIFGAIPSSYAITGFAIALITLSILLCQYRFPRFNIVAWVVSCIFAIGTTITNVIYVGWAGWIWQGIKGASPIYAMRLAIVYSVALMLLTLSANFLLAKLRDATTPFSNIIVSTDFVKAYTPSSLEQVKNFARFPEIIGRTFVPTRPQLIENSIALENSNPIKFMLTYRHIEYDWLSALLTAGVLVILIGGMIIFYNKGGASRWIGMGSFLSILTFAGLYSLFGLHTFLYSQHWQVPATVLIAAWFNITNMRSEWIFVVGLIALFGIIVGNVIIITEINSILAASAS